MSANEMEQLLVKKTSSDFNHGSQTVEAHQTEINRNIMSNFVIRARSIKEGFNRALVMVLVCITSRIFSLHRLARSPVVRIVASAEKMSEDSKEEIGKLGIVEDGLDEKKEMEWVEGVVAKEDNNDQVVNGIDGLIIQLEKKKKEWEAAASLPGKFALKMLTRIRNEGVAIKLKILSYDQEFTFQEHEMDLVQDTPIDPEEMALNLLKDITILLRMKKEHYSTGVDRMESEEEKKKFHDDYIRLVQSIVDKVQELSLHYQPGTSEYLVEKIDSSKTIDQMQEETGALAVVLNRWRDWYLANYSRIPDDKLHIEELFISLILEKLRLIDSRLQEDIERRKESSDANPALKWMRDLHNLHCRHWKKEIKLWMTASTAQKEARLIELRRALRKIDHHWKSYNLYSSPKGLETYRVVHVYRDIRSNQMRRHMAKVYIPGTEEDCPLKGEVETMECIVCRYPARARASDSDGYESDMSQSPDNIESHVVMEFRQSKRPRKDSKTGEPLSPEQLKLIAEDCKLTEKERAAFNAMVDKTDLELSNTPSTSQDEKKPRPEEPKEAVPEASEKRRKYRRHH